jgi:hypothetical protein
MNLSLPLLLTPHISRIIFQSYSIRILIIDLVNFLYSIWSFILFKIFLEKSYILLWFILLLKNWNITYNFKYFN